MISVNDIRERKFEKAAFGYKQEDIDEFLEELVKEVEGIDAERDDLNTKIQILADKVREYRQDEEALKDALLGAQKQGHQIVAEAQEKADTIIAKAEQRAQELIDEATVRHDEAMEKNRLAIEKEKENLKDAQKQVADFKRKLFDMYKTHLEMISAMPEAEFDDGDSIAKNDHSTPSRTMSNFEEEEPPKPDPFATTSFSARAVKGGVFSDLQFGQNQPEASAASTTEKKEV